MAGVIVCCQYARHNYGRLSLWDKGLFPRSLCPLSRFLSLLLTYQGVRLSLWLLTPASVSVTIPVMKHTSSPLPFLLGSVPPSFYWLPVIIASPSVSLPSSLCEHVHAWAACVILSLTLFCLQTIKTTKMQIRAWVLNAGGETLGMYKTTHCQNQRVCKLPEWLNK